MKTHEKDMFSDTMRELNKVAFWLTIGEKVMRYGKFLSKLLSDLMILAWLVLVTYGIWSDDLYLLQVAGTIFLAGLMIFGAFNVLSTIYGFFRKKPTPKLKPPVIPSAGVGDAMLQTFLFNKMKSDPIFYKEVVARMDAQLKEKMGGDFQRSKTSEGSTEVHTESAKNG